MMSERVQLNKRVPKAVREKVKADAERNPRISEDQIVASILIDFFGSKTVTERSKFYAEYKGH